VSTDQRVRTGPPPLPRRHNAPAQLQRRPLPEWPRIVVIASAVAGLGMSVWAFVAGGFCLGFFVLTFAALICRLILEGCRTVLRPAVRADYLDALEVLKHNPTDVTCRQNALAIGKEYSALSVDLSLKPQYTEMMIQYDLQAACDGS
jgi:hypothetical protein